MFTLSAFADEISPDPQEQIDVLKPCGVRHIELRSILKTNVLDLTDLQVTELKSLLDRHGFRLSAIGSPIGKIKIDQPFEPHLQRFERAIELCKIFETPNIRIFSYYQPEGDDWTQLARRGHGADDGEGAPRREGRRASAARERAPHLRRRSERVVDLLQTIDSPHLRAVYDAANYVFCGYDPWQGWQMTKAWTAHFHIKDWIAGE